MGGLLAKANAVVEKGAVDMKAFMRVVGMEKGAVGPMSAVGIEQGAFAHMFERITGMEEGAVKAMVESGAFKAIIESGAMTGVEKGAVQVHVDNGGSMAVLVVLIGAVAAVMISQPAYVLACCFGLGAVGLGMFFLASQPARGASKDRMAMLWEASRGRMAVLFNTAESGGVKPETIAALRAKWVGKELTVAVMGTAKAGKTTILNALIGREFLPTESEAQTSCLVSIVHDASKPEGQLFRMKDGQPTRCATGRKDVLEALTFASREGRKPAEVSVFELRVRVAAFGGRACAMRLVDTPGQSRIGQSSFEEEVVPMLKETADCVLYVLDHTCVNTTAELKLLDAMGKQILPSLAPGCVFHILNKMDAGMPSGHEEQLVTKRRIADGLSDMHKLTSVRAELPMVMPNEILPVSAKRAASARAVQDAPSEGELQDFLCLVRGTSWREYVKEGMQAVALRDAPSELKKSHFGRLESLLLELEANKGGIVHDSVLHKLAMHAVEIQNEDSKQSFQQECSKLKRTVPLPRWIFPPAPVCEEAFVAKGKQGGVQSQTGVISMLKKALWYARASS